MKVMGVINVDKIYPKDSRLTAEIPKELESYAQDVRIALNTMQSHKNDGVMRRCSDESLVFKLSENKTDVIVSCQPESKGLIGWLYNKFIKTPKINIEKIPKEEIAEHGGSLYFLSAFHKLDMRS